MTTLEISVPDNFTISLREIVKAMGGVIKTTKKEAKETTQSESDVLTKRRKALEGLKGCVSLPENFDYKEEYGKYLMEKYGL